MKLNTRLIAESMDSELSNLDFSDGLNGVKEKKQDPRNDIAFARDMWLESPTGKKCLDGTAQGKYLEHRLEYAFMAGWNACEENEKIEH